jgi:multiple sugar transport system permease protein
LTAVALTATESKRRAAGNGDAMLGILLVTPIILTMVALVFYPLVQTVWDSFHRINPMQPGTPWIGAGNYVNMLGDAAAGQSWVNTLIYVAIAVSVETTIGVLAAALINQVKFGRRWLLAAVILPWALPAVVNAVIWEWIYQPGAGLLNGILSVAGLPFDNHVWFNDRISAIVAVAVVHIWRMMPLTIVIVLAAMQSIPEHLYEAARIDGATRPQMFFSITLPLIRSAIAVAIYLETFQNLHFSYGMALSLVLTVVSLTVSLIFVVRIYNSTRLDA